MADLLSRWLHWHPCRSLRFIAALAVLTLTSCTLPLATSAPPAPTQPPVTIPATPTVAPSAVSAVTPTAVAAPVAETFSRDDVARIAAATPAARDQRALVAAFNGGDVPAVARTTPLEAQVGTVETFWVADVSSNTNYTLTARLRYAGPIVLMYVDTALDISQDALEQSARVFEERIYPRNRLLFGFENIPGIDGDSRLTVLNTRIRGAGGYFSSADGVTRAVNRFSNEREMFVIDAVAFPPGSDAYHATLAHEFQHMIHWHRQIRSPTWFNEGLATLAEDLNGFGDNGAALAYLRDPDVQLTTWASGRAALRHYGASQLFMRYFYEQYGDTGMPADWIAADAGNDPQWLARVAARQRPGIAGFEGLFADWAVANALNDPSVGDGRYAYRGLPRRTEMTSLDRGTTSAEVRQYGADYLGPLDGPLTLRFDGADTVPLVGVLPARGRFAWWSNRGDESVATLTRSVDLRGVARATLTFRVWHELERHYDYAFVAVSTDGGGAWRTLPGLTTSDDDPQGHNLGNGLTGVSGVPEADIADARGRWITERMDLTPFAGQQVLLRFWMVSDAALNGPGLLLDDIRIPETGFADDAEAGDAGWQSQGFVRTTGIVPQRWILRLIRFTDGDTDVTAPDIDAQGRAEVRLAEGERAMLLVSAVTPFTTEPAQYRIELAQAEVLPP
ncbi:MAG: immune inhibitor A [Chloroflexi bacterium]|nr:immune inhibitor A [Chloroflexota bacterium]